MIRSCAAPDQEAHPERPALSLPRAVQTTCGATRVVPFNWTFMIACVRIDLTTARSLGPISSGKAENSMQPWICSAEGVSESTLLQVQGRIVLELSKYEEQGLA